MEFKKKYLKYKEKYLNLKNQIGGLKTLNELQNPENRQLVNTISESTVTIINAHGGIDIDNWYVIPDNTYILTTSEIGGITCNNYNEVFNNLINEKLNRQNLKSMLSKTIEGRTNDGAQLNKKNTYKGLFELYEPYDVIPKINLDFHHNEKSSTSKDIIYTWLTYNAFEQNNSMSNSLFDSYFQVTPSRPLDIHIKKGSLINIGKFREYVYKIINDYETNLLNDFVESNNISDEFKNYFNKSSDEYNGRKGIFSLPVAYTVKNIEEQKFFSMVITLYIKKFDKLNYDIKEVVDTLDRSRVNLIVLTSCLFTTEIKYELLQKFYSMNPKNTLKYFTNQNIYINKNSSFQNESFVIPSFYEQGYIPIINKSIHAIRELLNIKKEELPAKLDRIKYLLEERIHNIAQTDLTILLNHIIKLDNIDVLKLFRINFNYTPIDILLNIGNTDSNEILEEILRFKSIDKKTISQKVCNKLNFLKVLINKNYNIECKITDVELTEYYITKNGIDNSFSQTFKTSSFVDDYGIPQENRDHIIDRSLLFSYINKYQIKDEKLFKNKYLFNDLLRKGYFNDKIELGRSILINNILPYEDIGNIHDLYLQYLQFNNKEEIINQYLQIYKNNKNSYLGLDSIWQYYHQISSDFHYKYDLLIKNNVDIKNYKINGFFILDILKNFNNYRIDEWAQERLLPDINKNIELLEKLGFSSNNIKINKEIMNQFNRDISFEDF
jgi:hypothetical protein